MALFWKRKFISVISAGADKPTVEELRNLIETSYLITKGIHTRINLTLHITLVNHRLGLSAAVEGNDLQNLTGVDSAISELNGIEINGDGLGGVSQLHRVFLSTQLI